MKNLFSTNSTSGNPTLSSEEVPTTTTVMQDPLLDDPSDSDCSHPPSLNQPRIEEPDQEVSVINIDIADVAMIRSI